MKITFTIRESELRAALCVAGQDESRPALCSVWFELRPNKPALLVATDGRRLAMIEAGAHECEGGAVGFALKREFCSGPFGYTGVSDYINCQYDSESKTLTMGAVTFGPKAFIDGNYPNYTSLLSDFNAGTPQVCLSANLLEGFSRAASTLVPGYPGLSYAFREESGVVEISCSLAPNFYGLLMPMRDTGFVRPSFVTDLIPAQEKSTHPACS